MNRPIVTGDVASSVAEEGEECTGDVERRRGHGDSRPWASVLPSHHGPCDLREGIHPLGPRSVPDNDQTDGHVLPPALHSGLLTAPDTRSSGTEGKGTPSSHGRAVGTSQPRTTLGLAGQRQHDVAGGCGMLEGPSQAHPGRCVDSPSAGS